MWLCVGPAEILLANIIMCHLSSEPWPRAGAVEAVRRGLHTRLGSYNNLAPASILVTVTHTITPSHQWWSVSQQHTLSTTVLTMQQYSNTHFSSGTSTVKSHLLGVFLAFSQVFFANYIELGMLKISTFEVTVALWSVWDNAPTQYCHPPTYWPIGYCRTIVQNYIYTQ